MASISSAQVFELPADIFRILITVMQTPTIVADVGSMCFEIVLSELIVISQVIQKAVTIILQYAQLIFALINLKHEAHANQRVSCCCRIPVSIRTASI